MNARRFLLRHPRFCRTAAFLLPMLLLFALLFVLQIDGQKQDFEQRAGQAADWLARTDRNSRAMLQMLAAIYQGMDDFDPARVSVLAASVRQGNPGTLLIAFANWVGGEEASGFVARMAEEGYPGFRIRGDGPHRLAAAGAEGYLPIRFIQPIEPRQLGLLGRDLIRSMADVSKLRELVAGGQPRVLPGWVSAARFAGDIFYGVPVYRGFHVPPSRSERLAQVDGIFVLGLSRTALLDSLAQRFPSLRFDLEERGDEASRAPGPDVEAVWSADEGLSVDLERTLPVFDGSRLLRARQVLGGAELVGPWVWAPPLALGLVMMVVVGALLNRAEAHEESQRKGRELELERCRAEGAMRSISDAVIMLDEDFRIRYLNRVAEEMLGLPPEKAIGQPADRVIELIDVISGTPLPEPHQWLERMCEGEVGPEVALNNHFREQVPVSIRVSRLEGHDHGGFVLAIRDTSREHELNSRLVYQAAHDDLTGLLNRSAFGQRVRAVLSEHRPETGIHALLFVDLDRFKLVNDTYGHEAGDQLLKMVADVLRSGLRDDDFIGRMGGDEFAILMRAPDMTVVGELADRLRTRLESMRFLWAGQVIDVHASLGVVPVDPELGGFEEVLKNADMACHAAKEAGRNTVHIFQPDDRAVGERRRQVQWLPRLQRALENDQFVLYRQTIWPARKTNNASPAFYEFLLRLRDTDGSDIAPGLFIPAAERFDMMRSLDRRVIALAMEAMGDPDCMPPDSRCTINLSGQSLTDEGLVDYIEEQAKQFEVTSDRVCFEITETVAITNLETARQLADRLRSMGFRLMLDDFGTGMSSLGYLHNLQVDYIKIDGQFVRNAVNDPLSAVSVRMICEIAQVLGLETVAEMIEDHPTVLCMRKHGVDYLQGFGLSRPEPVARSTKLRLAYSK